MSVYNIIWADDDIDQLLTDEDIEELRAEGFRFVAVARNGYELKARMDEQPHVDAVIVDANFNESNDMTTHERDVTGLQYARGLFNQHHKKIPFFLFTGRSDELLKEKFQDNYDEFIKDFPRHKRWFNKTLGERDQLFEEIKRTVEEIKSPGFIINNRYEEELEAADSLGEKYGRFVRDVLLADQKNDFDGISEPFVLMRKGIEKAFSQCAQLCLIPPIADNFKLTINYFVYGKYGPKKDSNGKYIVEYMMLRENLMPRPLAQSLMAFEPIMQDGAHDKDGLKLKVDEYYGRTKDTLLLRSAFYIFLDFVKWFYRTSNEHNDKEENKATLWRKCNQGEFRRF